MTDPYCSAGQSSEAKVTLRLCCCLKYLRNISCSYNPVFRKQVQQQILNVPEMSTHLVLIFSFFVKNGTWKCSDNSIVHLYNSDAGLGLEICWVSYYNESENVIETFYIYSFINVPKVFSEGKTDNIIIWSGTSH